MVAPLVVYGGDTQKDSGGGESYFTTTLRNVTVDGWVIIGILVVMFVVVAGIVMAGKALYLNRVARGNTKFLAEFHKLRDDPAALERREGGKRGDDGDAFAENGEGSQVVSALTASSSAYGVSTLWKLYHHGMRETMKRLEGQAAGADRVRIAVAAVHRSDSRNDGRFAHAHDSAARARRWCCSRSRSPAARSSACSARSSAS